MGDVGAPAIRWHSFSKRCASDWLEPLFKRDGSDSLAPLFKRGASDVLAPFRKGTNDSLGPFFKRDASDLMALFFNRGASGGGVGVRTAALPFAAHLRATGSERAQRLAA